MKATRLLPLALLGGATVVLLSCERQSVPLQPDLFGDLTQRVGLLQCTPLAPDSVTQTIGPEGGVLQIGPHTFTVPSGALDSAVTITAVMQADTINRVSFQPEGLTFQNNALLTMSYANCSLLGSLLPKKVAYISSALDILDYLPSNDSPFAQEVTGHIKHFSDYAIAW